MNIEFEKEGIKYRIINYTIGSHVNRVRCFNMENYTRYHLLQMKRSFWQSIFHLSSWKTIDKEVVPRDYWVCPHPSKKFTSKFESFINQK